MGVAAGCGVGIDVGTGSGVGVAVGTGVGVGRDVGVGEAVGNAVGAGVRIAIAVGMGFTVGGGMSVGAPVAPPAKEKATASPETSAATGTTFSGTSKINRPLIDPPGNSATYAPSPPPSALISSSVEERWLYTSALIPPTGDHRQIVVASLGRDCELSRTKIWRELLPGGHIGELELHVDKLHATRCDERIVTAGVRPVNYPIALLPRDQGKFETGPAFNSQCVSEIRDSELRRRRCQHGGGHVYRHG